MLRRTHSNVRNRQPAEYNAVVLSRRSRRATRFGKRARGVAADHQGPFVPPEDWHEPTGDTTSSYRIIVQEPGEGYRHVLSPEQIRQRLAQLPPKMLKPLEVIQLSRMTRKKKTFPCYGMQWGSALYLYPIENELIEYYGRPPLPAERIEATMYGGRWEQTGDSWRLIWSERAIQDFYLNNILIHELGHLLDDRNTSYADRERFAEWFAIEHGYRRSRRSGLARKAARKVVRRHHGRSRPS